MNIKGRYFIWIPLLLALLGCTASMFEIGYYSLGTSILHIVGFIASIAYAFFNAACGLIMFDRNNFSEPDELSLLKTWGLLTPFGWMYWIWEGAKVLTKWADKHLSTGTHKKETL